MPVRISLQGNAIAKIENLAEGKELFSLELEPELITGLYERIWQERRVVKLADVPPLLVKAILAVEDERFYQHFGIDPIGILRAMWVNLCSFELSAGRQHLDPAVDEEFFSHRRTHVEPQDSRSGDGADRRAEISKQTILENYLNEIYLGQRGSQGIFGVWRGGAILFFQAAQRYSPSAKPRCWPA